MYKAVNKTKEIWRYMEALSLHTVAPTLHWEDYTGFISVIGYKIFTTRFKHIDIPVFFLKEKIENGLFVPKYEKSSVMPSDMCTKPFSGPIISHSNKCMTGFIFYPTRDT